MSDAVQIRHNLAQLNATLADYQRLSDKSWPEVMAKQGGKLGYRLARNLRGLSPEKGSVREEMLERLRNGEGVRVRESVWKEIVIKRQVRAAMTDRRLVFGKGDGARSVVGKDGKRMNLKALAVAREIAIRESARGFLGFSARYPRVLAKSQQSFSRFGRRISEAGIEIKKEVKGVSFVWAGDNTTSANAAAGLSKPKQQTAIARALEELRDDMLIYVNRKEQEELNKAFSAMKNVILK